MDFFTLCLIGYAIASTASGLMLESRYRSSLEDNRELNDLLNGRLIQSLKQKKEIKAAWGAAHNHEGDAMYSGGLLADVCDAAFDDEFRAETQGYDGILARVKALVITEKVVNSVRHANKINGDK